MNLGLHFSLSAPGGEGLHEVYEGALRQCEVADQLGFTYAVVAEHHFMDDGWIPSPFVMCGAIAARTRRLQVGPNIAILPLRHVISVAEDTLVLDNLSDGRAVCGVGMGANEPEFAVFGADFKGRVAVTEEAMTVLARVMEEERVTHHGTLLDVEDLTVTPRPARGRRPPIWYGAISVPGARRAARHADALVMGPEPPLEKLVRMREAYEAELERVGKSSGQVILRREAYVGDTSEAAWRDAWEPLRFQYSQVYRYIDPDTPPAELREYASDRFVVGGPSEFAAEVERYKEALGIDTLLVRFQLPGLEQGQVLEAVHRLADTIAHDGEPVAAS